MQNKAHFSLLHATTIYEHLAMSEKTNASKRIKKELEELRAESPGEMSIGPVGDNLFLWEGNP